MKDGRTRPRLSFLALVLVLQMGFVPALAQAPDDLRATFRKWAKQSLHPVTVAGLDASTTDLRPIKNMIGDARIVALSEATHAAAEPLQFRNRLFKYLVEDMGFKAIAIESGIVESRVLNDYVVDGKGDLDTVVKQGLTWTFDTFPQNRELLRWMRDYNKRLPAGASKLQVFGFDVSGSPGNFSATRGPDTALTVALEYLRAVDPEPAAQILGRVGAFLPRLKSGSYGDLQQAERDSLTAAISDLIALVEHRRFQCIKKNLPNDCEWGQRAAIGAQQVDTWWRQMPVGWKAADGYEWTREASQTRESSMGDNLEWIAKRIGVRGRMLVFGAVAHIASTSFRLPDAPEREMFPFGAYARAHFGSDYLSILNMIVDGEIANCTANERKPISLKPSPIPSVESQFSSVNVPRYVIDLRNAPPLVLQWLRQPHDHWNGFGSMRFPTAGAFDLAFYASPITSACGYL